MAIMKNKYKQIKDKIAAEEQKELWVCDCRPYI